MPSKSVLPKNSHDCPRIPKGPEMTEGADPVTTGVEFSLWRIKTESAP